MFEGSINVPIYDEPLEKAGGENNAFTNNDITNYYLTIPLQNIETAFYLESDRMLGLNFSEKKLEVQKNVVSEEFRQRYLNQPYGDAWLLLRPLAYKIHPYRWPTIGMDIIHINSITLGEVKQFFNKYYNPSNAILTITGKIDIDKIFLLVDKWFGEIPKGESNQNKYPQEPFQTSSRELIVKRKVPHKMIYKAWHMYPRSDKRFYSADLLSDILSTGNSARLYEELVKKQKIFTKIDAFITGEADKGLFVISGMINDDINFEKAEAAIMNEINKLCNDNVSDRELKKVKNRIETVNTFMNITVLNKAMSLAYAEFLGNASLVNEEIENYFRVTPEDIKNAAIDIFMSQGSNTLYYDKI